MALHVFEFWQNFGYSSYELGKNMRTAVFIYFVI